MSHHHHCKDRKDRKKSHCEKVKEKEIKVLKALAGTQTYRTDGSIDANGNKVPNPPGTYAEAVRVFQPDGQLSISGFAKSILPSPGNPFITTFITAYGAITELDIKNCKLYSFKSVGYGLVDLRLLDGTLAVQYRVKNVVENVLNEPGNINSTINFVITTNYYAITDTFYNGNPITTFKSYGIAKLLQKPMH